MSGRPEVAEPQRVALWGNFGSGNLGNEATLEALACGLRRRLPRSELACICSVPDSARADHGLAALPLSPTRGRAAVASAPRPCRVAARLRREAGGWESARRESRRFDRLLFAGTGVLTDEGEGPLGLPHDIFKWAVAARAARTPHAFVSVGVEGIRHPLSRFFLRTALRLSRYVSFRDEPSRAAAAGLCARARAAPVYPDLAFSLPLPEPAPCVDGAARRVGVGVYDAFERGRRGGAARSGYREYVVRMGAFVLRLLDRGHDVQLLIGDVCYDVPVVEDLLASLAGREAGRPGVLCAEPARSVPQLLRQLASVDVVVATRFHNLLLALLLGRPALAIAHQAKDVALLQSVGLGAWCEPLPGLDLERLERRFAALAAEAGARHDDLLARAAAFRARLDEQYGLLLRPGPQAS